MAQPFILAQLSDPHIDLTPEADAHLEQAVQHLLGLPFPVHAVIISGDLTDSGAEAEYTRCEELLSSLEAPIFTVPGNHDHRERFLEAFGIQGDPSLTDFVQYVVEDFPLRLVALDTHLPNKSGGNLCETRLHWLEQRLAEAPNKPTLIFMHHPPFTLGNTILDGIGLENAEAFGDIVEQHRQIERIVAGHTHTLTMQRFGGTLSLTCPAVQTQMLLDVTQPDRLEAIMQPPSCLLHIWRQETGILTQPSLIGKHGPLQTFHDGERWTSDYTGK